MKLLTKMRILKARKKAELELGDKVPDWLVDEVLRYCQRKLISIKKNEDYLPLLYRCELPMQAQMRCISTVSINRMEERKEERDAQSLSLYEVPLHGRA